MHILRIKSALSFYYYYYYFMRFHVNYTCNFLFQKDFHVMLFFFFFFPFLKRFWFVPVGSQIVAHALIETGNGPNKPDTINL